MVENHQHTHTTPSLCRHNINYDKTFADCLYTLALLSSIASTADLKIKYSFIIHYFHYYKIKMTLMNSNKITGGCIFNNFIINVQMFNIN